MPLSTAELAVRTDQLPDDAYYHLMYTLRRALPRPSPDDPDALRRRDHAAIARIAALVPANAAEAETAALHVVASEQWKECLYLAQLPDTSPKVAMQCRNQANAMMRQSQAALRLFLRMQAVREKRESTNQSCDRAAFTEQCAINLMLEALEPPAAAQSATPDRQDAAPFLPPPALSPEPAEPSVQRQSQPTRSKAFRSQSPDRTRRAPDRILNDARPTPPFLPARRATNAPPDHNLVASAPGI